MKMKNKEELVEVVADVCRRRDGTANATATADATTTAASNCLRKRSCKSCFSASASACFSASAAARSLNIFLLKASAEGQQQLTELSNKNAQLQQQLQTTEKALARSEKELAIFHNLQEDASASFPVAYNRVQIVFTKLMAVLEWTDTAGILRLEFERRKTRALKDLRADIVERLGSAAYTLGDLKDQL
ncbi:hypothetical protein RI054_32g125750 [Pseudoscourfieldia marina]